MPRIARLTESLSGRGKAVVLVGAAAALTAGVGSASAATIGAANAPAPVHHTAENGLAARHAGARRAHGRREERHGSASPRGYATRPYEIYDSVTPSAIPSGHEVATYADGHFAASPAQ